MWMNILGAAAVAMKTAKREGVGRWTGEEEEEEEDHEDPPQGESAREFH